jgi:hypothetical protein
MSVQQVAGGPTKADIRKAGQPVAGSGISGKYTTINTPNSAASNEFPIVPFAPDTYDTTASIKRLVGDGDLTTTGFGTNWVVPFTEQDAAYLIRQQEQSKNLDYERWLWKRYNLSDPAQSWMFQQIAPEQYEKRKALIMYQQNLATRYAMLRLYGPKNQEDLMLAYLVDTKQIELPQGPVWDPEQWMAAQSGSKGVSDYKANPDTYWLKRYRAGMFSPMKYLNEDQVGHGYGANPADPLSFATSKIQSQLFAGTTKTMEPYTKYGQSAWASGIEHKYDAGNVGFGKN